MWRYNEHDIVCRNLIRCFSNWFLTFGPDRNITNAPIPSRSIYDFRLLVAGYCRTEQTPVELYRDKMNAKNCQMYRILPAWSAWRRYTATQVVIAQTRSARNQDHSVSTYLD